VTEITQLILGQTLKLAEIRQYEIVFQSWIDHWNRGNLEFVPVMFGVPRDDDPVFSKNVDKIGTLGADAAEIVLWYTLLKALRVHFIAIMDGRLKEMAVEQRIAFVQMALDLAPQMKTLGLKLATPPPRKRWVLRSHLWSNVRPNGSPK
jgi:hypothetical protein